MTKTNDLLPETRVPCDGPGCDEEINLLAPHLVMQLKARRKVLLSEEVSSGDPNEVPEPVLSLGDKTGRGVIKQFHDFECMLGWVEERKGLDAKLEYHKEGEIYVPEDNPNEEEIARREEIAAKEAIEAEQERARVEAVMRERGEIE